MLIVGLTRYNMSSTKKFAGDVLVYDQSIFIDTNNGIGYEDVVNAMNPYIEWQASKIKLNGYDRDDIKQFVIMTILDGIKKYDPTYNTKLSTFLFIYVKNRIISKIQKQTNQSATATYNNVIYKFICKCGAYFISNKEEATKKECHKCKTLLDSTWIARPIRTQVMSLDNLTDSYGELNIDKNISQSLMKTSSHINDIDSINGKIDINTIIEMEDEITGRIIDLVCNNDYSLTDAAKDIGMSCWATSLRLKNLKHKKYIQEIID